MGLQWYHNPSWDDEKDPLERSVPVVCTACKLGTNWKCPTLLQGEPTEPCPECKGQMRCADAGDEYHDHGSGEIKIWQP